MTDLSIIIVCYKGWDRLYKCLDSLSSPGGEDLIAEVIVVDNDSGDSVFEKIAEKYPRFRFISNKVNGGFANGSNLGAAHSTGDHLLFLNPDTVASWKAVGELLRTAKKQKGPALLSCRQVNASGKECVATGQFPSLHNLTGFLRAIFKSPEPRLMPGNPDILLPDWTSGSVMLMSHDTFNLLKGFDEDFWMYYEDVDICRRLRNAGGEILFTRSVTIEHNHGGSSRINLKTTSLTKTEVIISRHLYISKNKKGFEKYLIEALLVINNLVTGLITALAGLALFFVPKVFSRTLIFFRLTGYYLNCLSHLTWISPRSVNYTRKKQSQGI